MKKLLSNVRFLCLTLYLLSLFDCFCTVYGIQSGRGYEANPLMAFLLRHGIGTFIYIKMGITLAVCLIIDNAATKTSWALLSIRIICSIYLLVGLYHVVGMLWLS